MGIDPVGGPASGENSPVVDTREVLLVLFILAVAAVVRLGWPGLTEFKADEGRLLTAALTMSDGEFALRGISSSVGLPNAPMSVWLYSLPLMIWPHPYAATLFTGLLSVAAVGGTYWLGRRYWGVRTAAVAALMLAAAPWAIIFSRKIWAQNLLPVFAVGWAIGAALAFVERRRAFLILHLLCLAVAVQIHPAALGLFPATLLFLVVFRRRIDWRYLIIGGLLSLLTAAPFLWYLFTRGLSAGGAPFSSGQSARPTSLDSLRLILTIATGDGARALAGPGYSGLPGEAVARLIWLALIIGGIGWGMWLVIRRRDEPSSQVAFICLAWFILPALFFVWQWTPVYLHYFIALLPAPFLLAAVFFDRLMRSASLRVQAGAWVVLLVTIVMQFGAWGNLMMAIGREPLAGGFGIPLGVKLSAADGVRQALEETNASEVLLVGNGSNPDQQDFPAEFRALLHGIPVRYVDINHEAVFPAGASVALLEVALADGPTTTRAFYLTAEKDWRTFGIAGTELNYSVGALQPAAFTPPAVELQPSPLLANFVRLIGHNGLRSVAQGYLWDVYWRPADNPDPADYHIFNHLLDEAGLRLAQADGAAFAGMQWRPGDIVISRFLLTHVEGLPPLKMRVGMYKFPSLENVPVLDEAANPVADAVEIPLSDFRPVP
jgi:4-amino-4-deoxy-L-arabinose transferase-like glycosyltransferase